MLNGLHYSPVYAWQTHKTLPKNQAERLKSSLRIVKKFMTHQWDPEETLEEPLALELIREQFPSLPCRRVRLLGAGWDNTAFLVDEERIFRFPRRSIAVPLLEAEWCALPKLAPRLSLAIPHPKWHGKPGRRFVWPFIGYQMLPGFTACQANLSEKERENLAAPIARFLAELHQTPIEVLSECAISGDNQSRIDAKKLIPKIELNWKELAGIFRGKIEVGSKKMREPKMDTVVHGDFYVRHMLVDGNRRLAGVIDWGDIHVGDRAIDLAVAHSFLPASAHQEFRDAYGGVSEETWELARLRAVYSSQLLALYGHHAKDADILREGLRSLKMIEGLV